MVWVSNQSIVCQYLVVWPPNTALTNQSFSYPVREPDTYRIEDPLGYMGSTNGVNTAINLPKFYRH